MLSLSAAANACVHVTSTTSTMPPNTTTHRHSFFLRLCKLPSRTLKLHTQNLQLCVMVRPSIAATFGEPVRWFATRLPTAMSVRVVIAAAMATVRSVR